MSEKPKNQDRPNMAYQAVRSRHYNIRSDIEEVPGHIPKILLLLT